MPNMTCGTKGNDDMNLIKSLKDKPKQDPRMASVTQRMKFAKRSQYAYRKKEICDQKQNLVHYFRVIYRM